MRGVHLCAARFLEVEGDAGVARLDLIDEEAARQSGGGFVADADLDSNQADVPGVEARWRVLPYRQLESQPSARWRDVERFAIEPDGRFRSIFDEKLQEV